MLRVFQCSEFRSYRQTSYVETNNNYCGHTNDGKRENKKNAVKRIVHNETGVRSGEFWLYLRE